MKKSAKKLRKQQQRAAKKAALKAKTKAQKKYERERVAMKKELERNSLTGGKIRAWLSKYFPNKGEYDMGYLLIVEPGRYDDKFDYQSMMDLINEVNVKADGDKKIALSSELKINEKIADTWPNLWKKLFK